MSIHMLTISGCFILLPTSLGAVGLLAPLGQFGYVSHGLDQALIVQTDI